MNRMGGNHHHAARGSRLLLRHRLRGTRPRNALFRNEWPDPFGLLVYVVLAAFVMWLGWAWFEKTKKGFADVL